MMVEPVNLREKYGDQFKVAVEESYAVEKPQFRADEEPWLQVMPGRLGHVSPWDQDHVLACAKSAGPTARKLKAVRGVVVRQDGSDGCNVVIPLSLLPQVAEIVQLRRRYRLSAAEKARRVARLAKYQFQPAKKAPENRAVCEVSGSVDS